MRNLYKRSYLTTALILLGLISSYGQIVGQMPLAPTAVPQFVDPLPHFAGLRVDAKAGGNLIVKMVPHDQIALSTGTVVNGGIVGGVIDPIINPSIGKAHLWVYQISKDGGKFTPPLWPAFTIEAERNSALNVTYLNELETQTYSNVGLVVDHTLHWAAPEGMMSEYDGPPPTTVHLHGGEVAPSSDGGPDSWFTPGAAIQGPSYNPAPYEYPNEQEAATLWFHDHALGVTRLNVYAGLAGFYFLRGGTLENDLLLPGWSGDDLVQEVARPGTIGTFNPDPYLPEIEVVIQDRMFDTDGKLYFPNLPTNPLIHPSWTPEFLGDIITVNGKTWPYLSVAPRKYRFRILNGSNARTYELWLTDLATGTLGPVINQIGTDGGFLDNPVAIDPALGGKLLLMPGERADVVIDFTASTPGAIWTMRNSAKTPYPAGAPVPGRTLGRIMQFVVNGTMVDANGNTGGDLSELPATLKTINVNNVKLTDFAGNPLVPIADISKIRQLTLNEVMAPGGPLEALVNNTKWSGKSVHKDVPFDPDGIRPDFENVFADIDNPKEDIYYSEIVEEGKTEIWKIINLTGDAHPIHLHLVQSQLMSRQKYDTKKYNKVYDGLFPISAAIDPMTNAPYPGGVFIGGYGPPLLYGVNQTPGPGLIPTYGGNPDVTPFLKGPVKPANLNERGWKDTFIMYPGEVTTIIVRFAPTDVPLNAVAADLVFPFDPSEDPGYVWHCHIIDHEDNEMMRPYTVLASPARTLAPPPPMAPPPDDQLPDAINEVVLGQNVPNPFSGETRIQFTLPESAHVQLQLINSLGQVTTLIDGAAPAGLNTAIVYAENLKGGIYFYQLRTGNVTLMKKMVVLK